MKPYYYVYRVGDRAPKIKHYTLEEAERESLRLAKQHPESSFEILQCLGTTRMSAPSTFWMDGVIPPHVCNFSRAMDGTCFKCGEKDQERSTVPDNNVEPKYRMLEEGEVIEKGDEYTRDGDNWSSSGCAGSKFNRTSFLEPMGHFPHRRRIN